MEFNQAVLLKRIRKPFKKQLLILVTWMVVGIIMLVVGIEFFYPAPIVFGFAFIIVPFLLVFTAVYRYWKQRKKVFESLFYPTDFIESYNNIEKVKYQYDDFNIKYLEEEIEQFSMSWKQLIDIKSDENSIHLDFNEQGKNIWIPRKMTVKEELLEFEKLINEIKTTANNGEHEEPL